MRSKAQLAAMELTPKMRYLRFDLDDGVWFNSWTIDLTSWDLQLRLDPQSYSAQSDYYANLHLS